MITIPNTTCVAGALLLVQDTIPSMYALCFYVTKRGSFGSKNLLLWEWKQVTEFGAIMRKAHEICFIAQGNYVEVSTEMILLLTLVKVHYKEGSEFDGIDTSCEKDWPATTTFKDLPRVKITTCRRKAMRKNIHLM